MMIPTSRVVKLTESIEDAIKEGDYESLYKKFNSLKKKAKAEFDYMLYLIEATESCCGVLASRNPKLIKEWESYIDLIMGGGTCKKYMMQ